MTARVPSPPQVAKYLHICDTFIFQTTQGASGQKGPQLPILQGDHVYQAQDLPGMGK